MYSYKNYFLKVLLISSLDHKSKQKYLNHRSTMKYNLYSLSINHEEKKNFIWNPDMENVLLNGKH